MRLLLKSFLVDWRWLLGLQTTLYDQLVLLLHGVFPQRILERESFLGGLILRVLSHLVLVELAAPRYNRLNRIIQKLVIVELTLLRELHVAVFAIESDIVEEQTILNNLALLKELLVFGSVPRFHRAPLAQDGL